VENPHFFRDSDVLLLHSARDPEAMLAKLILINRYFYPDESATSQMASSLAFDLSSCGWKVHAITSCQHYTPSFTHQAASNRTHDVRIHRLWTTRLGRRHLPGRAIDYLTFYLSAFLWLILFARRGDVMVTLTDPPLMSVLSTFAAQIHGCRHINWLQDLFPEVACQLGVVSPGFWSRMITWQRNRALRSATMNVVIGEHMAAFLEQQNVPRRSITVIHNWSDGAKISPRPPEENPIRREWELEGKFVVGYSGNLGRAHDFQTVLQAAVALRHDASVRFLFVGGGHLFELLRTEVQRLSLSNVSIRPYQPDSRLRDSLTLPDVHLISLQPSLEGLVVPSKFYGIAAAGRPTIFIGDRLGEIPNILRNFDCGTSVAIGDSISLAQNIKTLQYDTKRREAWGANARALLVARFDRPHALRQWMHVLENGIASQALLLPTTSTNIIDNA
jgi:glycosyltransferase involved in cell wall biosynthesis